MAVIDDVVNDRSAAHCGCRPSNFDEFQATSVLATQQQNPGGSLARPESYILDARHIHFEHGRQVWVFRMGIA